VVAVDFPVSGGQNGTTYEPHPGVEEGRTGMSLAKILVAAAISVMEVSASVAQPAQPSASTPPSSFTPPQPLGSQTSCHVANLGSNLGDAAIGLALAVLWEVDLPQGKKFVKVDSLRNRDTVTRFRVDGAWAEVQTELTRRQGLTPTWVLNSFLMCP
jgi:hypothetical protein